MPTLTQVSGRSISDLRKATKGLFNDRPFGCPLDTVLDLPVPPSVNSTRRIDYRSLKKVNEWKAQADAALWANGQFKAAQKGIQRYELHILLDEKKCRLDADNTAKATIDYVRRLGIIVDDSKKHMRKLVIEWGSAPMGCRVTIKPLEAA